MESPRGGYGVVTPAVGAVVLVPFPFSDLSQSKDRPTVVIVEAGRGDWLLCQVTSNPYGDPRAVEVTDADFLHGSLKRTSYARPGKLFTANRSLMIRHVGQLRSEAFEPLIEAIVRLIQSGLNS